MEDKITFAELVDKIAVETEASKQFVHDFLSEISNQIEEGLKRDGHVSINGLGRFRLKWYEARKGINPQTGEEMEIPAQNHVLFTPEKDLREFINREYEKLEPKVIAEETSTQEPEKTETESETEPQMEESTERRESDKAAFQPESPASQSEEPDEPAKEKKRSYWWVWIIGILLILLLVFLLWPGGEEEKVIPEPQIAEQMEETPQAEPQQPVEPAEPEQPGISGGEHTVQAGDNLWRIANDFYGSAYLWPNIYRVNSETIDNPDILIIGNDVQIPALQGILGKLTEDDIEDIAIGFVETYLAYKDLGKDKAIYYLWVASKLNSGNVFDQYGNKIEEADLNWLRDLTGKPVFP